MDVSAMAAVWSLQVSSGDRTMFSDALSSGYFFSVSSFCICKTLERFNFLSTTWFA